MTDSNPWDWGTLLTRDGSIIPPGACEKYRGNKSNHRELVGSDTKFDSTTPDELAGGSDE